MPKISIITPIFNSEKFLQNCIESIQNQVFQNWELLLIDDGSTDNSRKICDEFAAKDNRILVFYKKNGGASSARNIGLENASGEWVTFIDSDDTIEQHYFDLLGFKEAELLIQRWRFSRDKDTHEPLEEGIYNGDSFIKFMEENAHKDIMRMVAAKFLKREVIEKKHIRFNTQIKLGEDTLFMQEYYNHIHSLAVSNTSNYIYYRPDNWGNIKYEIDYDEFRLFFREFYKSYKTLPYKSQKLYSFLFHFFKGKLKNKNSLKSKFFVNTLPECLRLERMFISHKNLRQFIKKNIALFLSMFNRFIK